MHENVDFEKDRSKIGIKTDYSTVGQQRRPSAQLPTLAIDPNMIDLSLFKLLRPTYAGLLGIDPNEKKKPFEIPFTN